jgi:hypothetical protein
MCLKADSGFRDCVILEANAIRCIPAKGGYLECRKRNPFLQHNDCVLADSGYAACMDAGGFHSLCMPARRSFQFCLEEDRMSIPFCTQVGKGFMECRKQFTLAHCMKADQGFSDCASE